VRISIRIVVITALILFSLSLSHSASAQGQGGVGDGDAAAKRLQQEAQGKNKFRRAEKVGDMNAAKKNMEELFKDIMISGESDSKTDKWHSPHLRDILIDDKNRKLEAVEVRGKAIPIPNIEEYCKNEKNTPIDAACPLTPPSGKEICKWHGMPYFDHRPISCCKNTPTTKYKELIKDSNFKTCCVRKAEKKWTSEKIACEHPNGDGWAGLFEFYFPTQALGWENDRTTTMIVDKVKVDKCFNESDKILKEPGAKDWVAKAIALNASKADGGMGLGGLQNQAEIQKNVADVIKDVHPQDEKIRMTDSLQSEGLTLRVNLATMDPEYREKLAKRFCMHPKQFMKIMDGKNQEDPVQKEGGPELKDLDQIPVWSNYCKEGVELMTDPDKSSQLKNPDTPKKTNFVTGMEAWKKDPLYCQRMNLTNANMMTTKIGEVVLKSQGKVQSQEDVGYTCLSGGKLNGSMVPVEMTRHAAVERRTAIADHAMGFLIAGGLAPGMIDGKKSYYKRFEPQPYSWSQLPGQYKTFGGKKWEGGGENELGDTCESIQGENYQGQDKSDRLFISNKTHEAFTKEMIDENKGGINRYVQEWAADDKKKDISKRGLDDKSQNYAAPYRIFASCPAGFVRWDPPADEHDGELIANLENFCREEFLGGLP